LRRGVVLLRAEFVDREGNAPFGAGLFGKRAALTCEREGSLEKYKLSPVADGFSVDFYVALPPGTYRYYEPSLRDDGKMLRFEVRRGAVECLGTIRVRHDYGAFRPERLDVGLHDDCEAIVQRFRTSYPEVNQDVEKEFFKRYTYDWQDRVWVPES
jgi:hypothetical protein